MKTAVCVDLDLLSPGGVETHIRNLSSHLRPLLDRLDIFARSGGLDVRSLQEFHPNHYQLIHTHGSSFPPRLLAWFGNRPPSQIHVHTLHGLALDYLLNCRAWLNWRCYKSLLLEFILSRHADHVIAVSNRIRDLACRFFQLCSHKITTIYNGFCPAGQPPQSRSALRARFGLSPDNLVFIFVGRGNDPVKGADLITASLDRLYRRYSHLRLLAVPGDGFSDAPWLRRSGPLPHHDMPACYTAADIFLNASLNEGLPLTLVEAMGAGLPVLAAAVGGIPEIVTPDFSGLLLCPDRSDLTAQLSRLIESPSLRQTLAQNARRAVQPLTWDHIARQTLHLYRSLLNRRTIPTSLLTNR